MKWLFFSLVLVNVALYLWATGNPRTAPDAARAQAQVNARSMLLLSEKNDPATTDGRVCMRIGPFLTQSTLADASRVLEDMGLRYNKTAVSARKLKTWRVYLEIPKDPAVLERIQATLSDLNVDSYQFEDNGSEYLSVGLFSQAGDARNFVSELKERDIETTYRPELRTLGPLRWIEVENVPDRYAREQLDEVRWGDAMASVTNFPCRA